VPSLLYTVLFIWQTLLPALQLSFWLYPHALTPFFTAFLVFVRYLHYSYSQLTVDNKSFLPFVLSCVLLTYTEYTRGVVQ